MSYVLILDPSEVATSRSELDLNSGVIRVDRDGIDWGDAAIEAYMAQLAVGQVPVDYRLPNRTITIPLFLGADDSGQAAFDAARALLNRKVGLFQREGGWLKRESNVGPLYADIVNATLTEPDRYGEAAGVESDVKLVLECLPDFYGNEVDLGATDGVSGMAPTYSNIAGDHPGRVRIVVTNEAGADFNGLLWALRSRYLDAVDSAHSVVTYGADELTEITPGVTAAPGVTLSAGAWMPLLSTTLAADDSDLTHRGAYRVWARCWSSNATPKFRFIYDVGDLALPEENDVAVLPAAGGDYLLDLGSIYLEPPPVGAHRWRGVVQAYGATNDDTAVITELILQPISEFAGRLASDPGDSPGVVSVSAYGTGSDDASYGTDVWSQTSDIGASDGTFAVAAPGSAASTHYLKATGFGFELPSTATVTGIKVTVTRLGIGQPIYDDRVRLVRAGVVETTDKADTATPWPASSNPPKEYGGAADLWGAAWTYADINDAEFGVVLSAKAAGTDQEAFVDAIEVAVYYTIGSGFETEDAVVFDGQVAELRTEGMYRDDSAGSGHFGRVSAVIGDLPRIPPSGDEGRSVELFVRTSRGNLDDLPDAATADPLSVRVLYRPSYLFRP